MKNVQAAIKRLKGADEYVIDHPNLSSVQLRVYREVLIEQILGHSTTFYGTAFKVQDNADNIHQIHQLDLTLKETVSYVESLCTATTKQEFFYIRTLKEKGLAVGDVIEFEDGKQGIIVSLTEVDVPLIRSLFFVPLKKDGSQSKVKPRILYGTYKYKKLAAESEQPRTEKK